MSFKQELKELLEKYNASIEFDCSPYSDRMGISEERIVCFDREGRELASSEVYSWILDAGNIQ